MDSKSKVILIVVFFVVCVSVAFIFYKTIIHQDFEVVSEEE